MNLINDNWIPAIHADGSRCKIAPWHIAETENPVVELAAPRADFQGALYQFLIGLLQTAFAPEDHDEWLAYWHTPPTTEVLREAFGRHEDAFELINPEGVAFMQDFSLSDGEQKLIASLLIEAPGAKTRKDNLDHFVKGKSGECMCPACAATALFTLQIYAPSGGQGHRVGLRGGGPLTTLVMPAEAASLWQRLWANVLTREDLELDDAGNTASIYPWMSETRLSDKSGGPTLPGDVHPLHMYWAMPRRIRLEFETVDGMPCMVCGALTDKAASYLRTKNFGYNYEGPWVHPLTPYRFDLKHQNPPLSLKGQPGGIGYRHWLGLTWQDESNGDKAALVVQRFNSERSFDLSGDSVARLWSFGYDMDNMKARCCYESTMPLLSISSEKRTSFLDSTALLLDTAKEAVSLTRSFVKAAWFSRPKDVKGDMRAVDHGFWHNTEPAFYRLLAQMAKQASLGAQVLPAIAESWLSTVKREAVKQFDCWVLEGDAEDLDMKRIIKARNGLNSKLNSANPFKDLKQIATSETEAA
ncbi:MAG: type I-E CRISPR-associated protein Cse1/CasA [Candidatus Marinimicrobia bacterium]|nr:type I-E CRISPR-associated protein Cse1/CasA [Candidatus Neomarinimicrobiota bacterium]MCF7851033.1 type I-E CRISPR-associated protein Cse1/CasA [Candidatus Neomarinimicrobiota bacterium]